MPLPTSSPLFCIQTFRLRIRAVLSVGPWHLLVVVGECVLPLAADDLGVSQIWFFWKGVTLLELVYKVQGEGGG